MLDDAHHPEEQEAFEKLYLPPQETKNRCRRKYQSARDTTNDRSFGLFSQLKSLLRRCDNSYSTHDFNRDRGFIAWNARRRRPRCSSDADTNAYDTSRKFDPVPSGRFLVTNRSIVNTNRTRCKQNERVTRTNEKALKAAFPGGEGLDSAPNRTRKRKQDNGYEGASETKFRHITASVDDIFLSCKIKHQLEGYPIHQDYPTEGNLGNVHRHKHGYCACLNPYPLGNIAYYLMCDV